LANRKANPIVAALFTHVPGATKTARAISQPATNRVAPKVAIHLSRSQRVVVPINGRFIFPLDTEMLEI
jgi:hypothetical protein